MKTIFMFIFLLSACYARNPLPDHTDNTFQQDCLAATNRYRAKHHAPPFKLDNNIINYAKSRCQLTSQSEGLHHSIHQGYGENLFWSGSPKSVLSSCSQAIDLWYNQVNSYNYNNPVSSSGTQYFTQLVWKSTNSVGCARCGGKGDKSYETYIVCDFKPEGNIIGKFQDNVLRP